MENLKKCSDLLLYIKQNFTIQELDNRELAMLFVYCQNNKDSFLSTLPDRENHYYKKHLNLYSIKEMIVILQNKKMDGICARLMESLRKEDAIGRTKLNWNIGGLKELCIKYL